MTLGLSRLPWYAQVAAFVALSAAGSGVSWHWYARPVEEDLAARRVRLATLRGDISRDLATARRVPEFRREAAVLQRQLDELRTVLPEDRDAADLLRRVEATATESNLAILAFTPQVAATRQLYAEWPIALQIEGTYHDLGTFLDRISRFPRLINVGDISIRAKDSADGATTITARFTVTTFVLVDQAAEEEPVALASTSLVAQSASPMRPDAEQPPLPAPPSGFTYSPEGRRDPFVSPLRREPAAERRTVTPRPADLAGLDASGVALRGTVRTHEGFVAILQGTDRKTYIVRAGDRLLDGVVLTISQQDIVILQQADDPRSIGKSHEVRKVLRQAEAR